MGRDEILLENIPWVRQIAASVDRLHNDKNRPMSRDDLIACGMAGLCSALDRYDSSYHTLFQVYARRRVQGAMLDGLRQWSHHTRTQRPDIVSLDAAPPMDEPTTTPSSAEMAIDLETLLTRLPRDEEEVLRLRYYDDMSRRDIALTLGCSIRHVDDLRTRGLRRMRSMLCG